MSVAPRSVPGEHLGVTFPTSVKELLLQGPAFLTEAFHAAGSLLLDNRVTAITDWREVALGGMGRKLAFTVAYERPDPTLHTDLFAKFPRDFGDPLRDVFSEWMAPEIRFALLSRDPVFPIRVPRCYFADFDPATMSGLLITEQIPYGRDGIELCPDKAADYELADPLVHYQAVTRAMARLAAHQRLGSFGDRIDVAFPIEAAGHELRPQVEAAEMRAGMTGLKRFAEQYPQLFDDGLGEAALLQSIADNALMLLELAPQIVDWIGAQRDYLGLCHSNLNLDNGWFWRDGTGELEVGLLDWGNVGQMPFARAIIGMICCAETDFVRAHRDGLIDLFADEFQRHSAASLDPAILKLTVKLALPLLALGWMGDIGPLIETMVPDLATVPDRFDPRIRNDVVVRSQLRGLMIILSEWRANDVGGMLRAIAAGTPIEQLA